MMRFSHEQQLRPWHAVRDEFNRQSNERLSMSAVVQICNRAEQKIRHALEQLGVSGDLIEPEK